MPLEKADLILHPVRLRILQELVRGDLSTQELAERLADVPVPSLYRHLKVLLDGGMLRIADTRRVKGTLEKVYHLAVAPTLNAEDLTKFSREDHLRYFSMYLGSLLEGFADYIETSYAQDGENSTSSGPDYVADKVGYSVVEFYASDEELKACSHAFNAALIPLAKNGPGAGRVHRKIAVISHPIQRKNIHGTTNS
jgi:DNA-binding transcriptional ArsR family regulator